MFTWLTTDDFRLSFFDVMDVLGARLKDNGPNWRHVQKALKVFGFCLRGGWIGVARWARENLSIVKTLREFHYVDKDGTDSGMHGMLPCASPPPS